MDVEGECGCGAAGVGVVGMWMWWKQTWALVDVEMKDVEAGMMLLSQLLPGRICN